MEFPKNQEFPGSNVIIDGIQYSLVLKRMRGAGIYVNANKDRYLRIGDPAMVAKELGFHRRLLSAGFPVAEIVSDGTSDGMAYWIEESLGDEHMTGRFRKDFERIGSVSDELLETFIRQVVGVSDAQARSCEMRPYDFDRLAVAVGEDGMEEELPDLREDIRAAWDKATARIADLPECLTHGDLTTHNVMERGVIDFGDHFEGPLGYDAVTAITAITWFPNDRSCEFFKTYDLSREQFDRFLERCDAMETPYGTFRLRDRFDDLYFLKALWWSVRNHHNPKLQAWRYGKFREILRAYLAGESLLLACRKEFE